jgi:hypothetical protein
VFVNITKEINGKCCDVNLCVLDSARVSSKRFFWSFELETVFFLILYVERRERERKAGDVCDPSRRIQFKFSAFV